MYLNFGYNCLADFVHPRELQRLAETYFPYLSQSIYEPLSGKSVLSSYTVRDVTWMSNQSLHSAKWMAALDQVTVRHLVKCPKAVKISKAVRDVNF